MTQHQSMRIDVRKYVIAHQTQTRCTRNMWHFTSSEKIICVRTHAHTNFCDIRYVYTTHRHVLNEISFATYSHTRGGVQCAARVSQINYDARGWRATAKNIKLQIDLWTCSNRIHIWYTRDLAWHGVAFIISWSVRKGWWFAYGLFISMWQFLLNIPFRNFRRELLYHFDLLTQIAKMGFPGNHRYLLSHQNCVQREIPNAPFWGIPVFWKIIYGFLTRYKCFPKITIAIQSFIIPMDFICARATCSFYNRPMHNKLISTRFPRVHHKSPGIVGVSRCFSNRYTAPSGGLMFTNCGHIFGWHGLQRQTRRHGNPSARAHAHALAHRVVSHIGDRDKAQIDMHSVQAFTTPRSRCAILFRLTYKMLPRESDSRSEFGRQAMLCRRVFVCIPKACDAISAVVGPVPRASTEFGKYLQKMPYFFVIKYDWIC